MAKIDIESIRKLPPEKRIEALKQLEEELNKAVEESSKEIEHAHEMLKEAESQQRVLEEIETPQPREIKVDELFAREEGEELEALAQREEEERLAQRLAQEDQTLAQQTQELYNRVRDIYQDVRDTGTATEEQRHEMYELNKQFQKMREDFENAPVRPGEKTWNRMTAAEQIITYMKHGEESYKRT